MNIPKVLGTAFFTEILVAAFALSLSIKKELLKKETWEIVFALISLFHVQIQLPQEHLSLLQNLLIFFITKYLKEEVNNDLSVYVDEFSSCGLSITGDIKICQCHMIKRWWRYYPQIW